MAKIKVKYLSIGDYVVVVNNNNTILELDKTYQIKQIQYNPIYNKYYLSLVGNFDLRYKINRFRLDIKTERKHKLLKMSNHA